MTTNGMHEALEKIQSGLIEMQAIHPDGVDTNEVLLSEFIVVCHWQPINGDEEGDYTVTVSNPNAPHHHHVGLLSTALAQMH